jgi:hypothetical protein
LFCDAVSQPQEHGVFAVERGQSTQSHGEPGAPTQAQSSQSQASHGQTAVAVGAFARIGETFALSSEESDAPSATPQASRAAITSATVFSVKYFFIVFTPSE